MDTFYRGRIDYTLGRTSAALGALRWIDLPHEPAAGQCSVFSFIASAAGITARTAGTWGCAGAAYRSGFHSPHGKQRARYAKPGDCEVTRTASNEFSTILFHCSPLWETCGQRPVSLLPPYPIRKRGPLNLQPGPYPPCYHQTPWVPPPPR